MNLLDRVTIEPDKCGGKPCLRGYRIRVGDVLGLMGNGATINEILANYPFLEREDIYAALLYASSSVERACSHADDEVDHPNPPLPPSLDSNPNLR
ncbi:MAG: DUF433 domain-containing protein [Verrucomicrobiota bacterium]|nr:DUF433 domain-containing protein [Verrucomicrobiota bacterium]